MDNLSRILAINDDGMATYDYIVNNEESCIDQLDILVDNLKKRDLTGQFLASGARFLSAVNPERFAKWIGELIESAIDKDKERKYIGSLLEAIWGPDYKLRAEELQKNDENFRRIYKRLFPTEAIGFYGHNI